MLTKGKHVVRVAVCHGHSHIGLFTVFSKKLGHKPTPTRYNSPQVVRFIIKMQNRRWKIKEE